MRKNLIAIGIVGILLLSCLAMVPVQANETTLGRHHLASGVIFVAYNSTATSTPIMPLSEVRVIPLNISYTVIAPNFISRMLNRRNIAVPIQLSIEDKPDYCTATIFPETVFCNISDGSIAHAELRVVLDQTAPAFTLSNIKIEAEAARIKGRLGLLTMVHCAQAEFEIPIIPGYLPLINVEAESDIKTVTPGQGANFSININNLGNALTNVTSEVLNAPLNWVVSLPSNIMIGVGNSTSIKLNFTTDAGFTRTEVIQVAFTPRCYCNSSLHGIATVVTFAIQANI